MPHTPGPWKVLTLDDGTEWVQADCGTCNARIAIVDDSAGCQPGNAHLIAAAPELLEALENCLGFVVAHPQFTEDLRDLIAKAREVSSCPTAN